MKRYPLGAPPLHGWAIDVGVVGSANQALSKGTIVHFISQTSSNGVVERGFTIGEVTGLLWTPIASSTPAPLVLMGHGGGQHKRAPGIVSRAVHFVTTCGFAVAAIDAPGHGDRPRTVQDEEHVAALRQAQEAGDLVGAIARYNTYLSDRAVPEWQATLDALRTLPDIAGPVGYWAWRWAPRSACR